MKNIIISVALLFSSVLCSPAAVAGVEVFTLDGSGSSLYASLAWSDLDLLPQPEARKTVPVAASEDNYSHLPEPPMASMLLLGIVLIGLSIREEKDEKFSN
jgi:hypothetical protein